MLPVVRSRDDTTARLAAVPVSSAAVAFNWAYVAGCAAVTAVLWICYREQSKRYDFDSAGLRPAVQAEAAAEVVPKSDESRLDVAVMLVAVHAGSTAGSRSLVAGTGSLQAAT